MHKLENNQTSKIPSRSPFFIFEDLDKPNRIDDSSSRHPIATKLQKTLPIAGRSARSSRAVWKSAIHNELLLAVDVCNTGDGVVVGNAGHVVGLVVGIASAFLITAAEALHLASLVLVAGAVVVEIVAVVFT
jgi:hypothetical protein